MSDIELCPAAPRKDWPFIAAMFRRGFDTATIAHFLKVHEALVANALRDALQEARA